MALVYSTNHVVHDVNNSCFSTVLRSVGRLDGREQLMSAYVFGKSGINDLLKDLRQRSKVSDCMSQDRGDQEFKTAFLQQLNYVLIQFRKV